jgi:hypothetical protein
MIGPATGYINFLVFKYPAMGSKLMARVKKRSKNSTKKSVSAKAGYRRKSA